MLSHTVITPDSRAALIKAGSSATSNIGLVGDSNHTMETWSIASMYAEVSAMSARRTLSRPASSSCCSSEVVPL